MLWVDVNTAGYMETVEHFYTVYEQERQVLTFALQRKHMTTQKCYRGIQVMYGAGLFSDYERAPEIVRRI